MRTQKWHCGISVVPVFHAPSQICSSSSGRAQGTWQPKGEILGGGDNVIWHYTNSAVSAWTKKNGVNALEWYSRHHLKSMVIYNRVWGESWGAPVVASKHWNKTSCSHCSMGCWAGGLLTKWETWYTYGYLSLFFFSCAASSTLLTFSYILSNITIHVGTCKELQRASHYSCILSPLFPFPLAWQPPLPVLMPFFHWQP